MNKTFTADWTPFDYTKPDANPLPEPFDEVLVTFVCKDPWPLLSVGCFVNGKWGIETTNVPKFKVIAWTPLPYPYEPQAQEPA